MTQRTESDLSILADDGFAVTAAEPWVKQKVQLIRQYLDAFVTAASGRVDEIIVVDMYARNGLYCLGNRKEIFAGVPIMSLQSGLPISKFIFCEQDMEQLRTLKIRISKWFRSKHTVLLEGKPEQLLSKLQLYVPEWRKNHKAAVFCICDSFSLDPSCNLVRILCDYGFTFLMPSTFHLGNKIDYRFYLQKETAKLKEYMGTDPGELKWKESLDNNLTFYKQLVRQRERQLEEGGLDVATSTHKLDSGLMEIPVYSFTLASKKFPVKAIQLDALAGSHVQFTLFNQN